MVAGGLHVGEGVERDIKEIGYRPDGLAVGGIQIVVFSGRGKVEGDFILIVVVFHVRSHPDEQRDIAVLKIGGIIDKASA